MKIKLNTQDARLLHALLGKTYAGLSELYDELGVRLEEKGYDTCDADLDDRLTALMGPPRREPLF